MSSLRDYGLGDSTENVTSKPRLVSGQLDEACPNCGGIALFGIHVDVEHPNLKGSKGTGFYVGCAACPYASPMLMTAGTVKPKEEDAK